MGAILRLMSVAPYARWVASYDSAIGGSIGRRRFRGRRSVRNRVRAVPAWPGPPDCRHSSGHPCRAGGVDPGVLARSGADDLGAPSAHHEVVVPVDLAHYELLDNWDDYIGQAQQMDELRLMVDSARVRHGRIPHTLMVSDRSGMGRRAAIRLAARQLGKGLVELCAPFTIDQLAQAVDHLGYADFLFIEDLDMAHGPGVGAGTLTSLFERRDLLHPRDGSHFVDEISIVASRPDPTNCQLRSSTDSRST